MKSRRGLHNSINRNYHLSIGLGLKYLGSDGERRVCQQTRDTLALFFNIQFSILSFILLIGQKR